MEELRCIPPKLWKEEISAGCGFFCSVNNWLKWDYFKDGSWLNQVSCESWVLNIHSRRNDIKRAAANESRRQGCHNVQVTAAVVEELATAGVFATLVWSPSRAIGHANARSVGSCEHSPCQPVM